MSHLKAKLKSIIPKQLYGFYHTVIALSAAIYYRFPGQNMVMIGITGTKGKTSTANFVWSVLKSGGYSVGLIGTANIRYDTQEEMNPYHMTMPGPFITQKMLRKMKNAGCTHVVMEATSEGLKLNRHLGIYFDIAVFTNLSPEHLPSHGNSYEKYRAAKLKLFKSLNSFRKTINGTRVEKVSIINTDSEDASHFLRFNADKQITYGLFSGDVQAKDITPTAHGTIFYVNSEQFELTILGAFNVANALPAICIGQLFEVPVPKIRDGIKNLRSIPGRMEEIILGQPFRVIVDYAHEKLSMNALLDTARNMIDQGSRVLVLFGAQGGGRDKSKRESMGIAAGTKADYVILTSDDSYEEDPLHIIRSIAQHVIACGKREGENLFLVVDRREAIAKAFSLAKSGDIVLLAGKGAEQSMITKNGMIPWDDRTVARDIIHSQQ